MRVITAQKSPSIFSINLSLFFCLISGFIFIPTANAAALCAPDANGNLTVGSGEGCANYELDNALGADGIVINSGLIDSSFPDSNGIAFHIYPDSSLLTLNNPGSIQGDEFGIYNKGSITNLSNSGITLGGLLGIYNIGSITNLSNIGAVLGVNINNPDIPFAMGVANSGTVDSLINFNNSFIIGVGFVGSGDGKSGVGLLNSIFYFEGLTAIGSVNTLINHGSIIGVGSVSSGTLANFLVSTDLAPFTDADNIIGSNNQAFGINNQLSTITTLTNNGTIIGTVANNVGHDNTGSGIDNFGTITTLTNNGTISGEVSSIGENNHAYGIYNSSTITTLTNNGIISGTGNGTDINSNSWSFDIFNTGTIETLNNRQGASSSALTFYGNLPTNYNIIINSTSDFGKINFSMPSGSTTFGISTLSIGSAAVSLTPYSDVLRGITDTQLGFSGTSLTATSNGYRYTLSQASAYLTYFNWDLLVSAYGSLGPTAADTQASLTTQARRLRSTFNSTMAASNFANMNTYDCNLFDKNNMCISAGGRYTNIDNPSSNNSAAVVVLGYNVSHKIRIGGFLDQSVNHNMPSGVDMSNKNPMMGAFAVWNHQADGLGFQMKLANAYLDKDVTTSRAVIGTSEAGRGRTDLNTQSYVGELSYAFQYQDSTIVRPYFAVRYTNIKQDAYTEDTTASVTAPLTYAKLSDRSTTALMGVKLNHALTPRTNLTASLGVEQDINHKTDQLTASGVADLTSENFNNNIKRTRPVASAGAYYAVTKTQRLSGEVYYQQLPFQSTGSTTAYFNYMIGF